MVLRSRRRDRERRRGRRPAVRGDDADGDGNLLHVLVTLAGLVYLAIAVNFISASVTALITVCYLLLYTPMKPRSSLCMLVGAVPGDRANTFLAVSSLRRDAGDSDGARELLNEVMKDGDAAQKGQAQQLLTKLG